jgi:hypothetical protein
LCFGLGEWLGFGVGELDVLLGVGEGEPLGVLEGLGLGVAVAVADADLDVLGLDEGLTLADVLGEGDVLPLADELADLNRDAEDPVSAADSWFAARFVAEDNVVLFGISRHTADLLVDWLLASAVCNSTNRLHPMNAKPASAPTAAGLSISALTCESSCAFGFARRSGLPAGLMTRGRHDSHIMHGCLAGLKPSRMAI